MRVSRFLLAVILIFGVTNVFVFNLFDSDLVDQESLLLICLVLLALAGFLAAADDATAALLVPLTVFVLMFVEVRFLIYCAAEQEVGQRYLSLIDVRAANNALAYILIGILAVGSGIFIGCRDRGRKRVCLEIENPSKVPVVRLVILFWIAMSITGTGVLWFGFGNANASAAGGGEGSIRLALGLLTLFMNDTPVLFFVIVAAAVDWKGLSQRTKAVVVATVLADSALLIVGGARSSLEGPVLFATCALLARYGDMKVRTGLVSAGIIAVTASILLFPVATGVRKVWYGGASVGMSEGLGNELVGSGKEGWASQERSSVCVAADRLNGLDVVGAILNTPEDRLARYVTFENAIKAVINRASPGFDPFPGALNTARLYNLVILDVPLDELLDNYQTSMWTMWGICYAHFGWWGGVVAMFAFGLGMGWIQRRLLRRHTAQSLVERAWLILFFFYGVQSFGFDVWITNSLQMFLTTAVGVSCVLWMHDQLRRRVPAPGAGGRTASSRLPFSHPDQSAERYGWSRGGWAPRRPRMREW
jgi:hypothetical protein